MKLARPTMILALMAACGLGGCTGPVIMGTDAAIIYVTKPGEPPPADVRDQIVAHESWCYRTAGDVQCFAHPQDVPPERLVMVDPQNAYPIDLAAYHQALIAPPLVLAPVADGAAVPPSPALPPPGPADAPVPVPLPMVTAPTDPIPMAVLQPAPAMLPAPSIIDENDSLQQATDNDQRLYVADPVRAQ